MSALKLVLVVLTVSSNDASDQQYVSSDACAKVGDRFRMICVTPNAIQLAWGRPFTSSHIVLYPRNTDCNVESTAVYDLSKYTFSCDSNMFTMDINSIAVDDLDSSWIVTVNGKQLAPVTVRLCEAARVTLAHDVWERKDVTLSCTGSRNPYPQWTGPNLDGSRTTYNYLNKPIINGYLGEKVNRLLWDPQNNKSLIMKDVVRYDSGLYTCYNGITALEQYTVTVTAQPQSPVISNKVSLDETRSVFRSTEDQPVELTCTLTGGYPKPNLRWYRGNNNTTSLISNETSEINSDGNYIVVQKYKFTPTRQDDRVLYICQSSFDIPEPSYLSDQVLLYLNLKPKSPLIETYTIVEGILGKAAICTASQYRPNNAQVWLQIDGYNTTDVPDITVTHNVTTETFTIVAVFNLVLNRDFNGQVVPCHISHDTLQTPLIVTSTIPVYYAPDVEVINTNVTVVDTAILTCKPSGLPAVYTYSTWGHTWPGHGTVTGNRTLGNNQTLRLTSLTYEYSGVYHCFASNGVTGSLSHNAGHGAAFLQVGTFPIILTQSPIQVFTTLKTDISVTIHFYSNRRNNMVQCSRNSTKFSCASILEDVDISLPVFDFIVRTNGLAAKVFLSIHERNQFGTFTVTISNDVGETKIDVNVLHSEETRTIQAEHTTNVALVLGLVGLALGFIFCIIAVVVFVVWKRRVTENDRHNTSLKCRTNPSTENESPTEDFEMGPRQYNNCTVDTHVYEELGEGNENILECERLSSGNDRTVSRSVAYENLQIES